MNQKIKEMIKQADSKCSETRGLFDEILVQMVIQECIELCNHDELLAPVGQSVWSEAYQEGWIAGVSTYKDVLSNHFGIE